METVNLKVKEVLTFIPSGKNYSRAIEFYQEIGFSIRLENCGLLLFQKR